MKRLIRLSGSIRLSVLMNPLSDAQIAAVLHITVEIGFSRHLYSNRRYYLFSGCFCSCMCVQSRISILELALSRTLMSNVKRAWQSRI
jgi:hypothetical protein